MPKKRQLIIVYKGGVGSGFWRQAGHRGIPGVKGGSTHHIISTTKRQYGLMSHHTGRAAELSKPAVTITMRSGKRIKPDATPATAYRDGLYYSGDLTRTDLNAEEIYAGSHPDVQALADKTGLIATDKESYAYIQAREAAGDIHASSNPNNRYTVISAQDAIDRYEANAFNPADPYYLKDVAYYGVQFNRGEFNRHTLTYEYPEIRDISLGNNLDATLLTWQGNTLDTYASSQSGQNNQVATFQKIASGLDVIDSHPEAMGTGKKPGYDDLINIAGDMSKTMQANGIHPDSVLSSSNILPMADEIRAVSGVTRAFRDTAIFAGQPTGKNDKYKVPLYDTEGKVVGYHSLAYTRAYTAAKKFVDNPDATLQDLRDSYDSFVNMDGKRPSALNGYYTPNGDNGSNKSGTLGSIDTLIARYGANKKVSELTVSIDAAVATLPDGMVSQSRGMVRYGILQAAATKMTPAQAHDLQDTFIKVTYAQRTNDANRRSLQSRDLAAPDLKPVTIAHVDISPTSPLMKAVALREASYTNSDKPEFQTAIREHMYNAFSAANPAGSGPKVNAAAIKRYTDYVAMVTVDGLTKSKLVRDVQASIAADPAGGTRQFYPWVENAYQLIHNKTIVNGHLAAVSKLGADNFVSYHGTHYSAARSIATENFRIMSNAKAGRMLGDGIYLAPSANKSAQYVGERFSRSVGTKGVMFVVHTTLGKVHTASKTDGTEESFWGPIYKKGVNTVYAPAGSTNYSLASEEYSVRDPMQNIPRFWMDITLKNR
jgi:hypothetical protein